jgi:hypothetical protein
MMDRCLPLQDVSLLELNCLGGSAVPERGLSMLRKRALDQGVCFAGQYFVKFTNKMEMMRHPDAVLEIPFHVCGA